MMDHRWTRRRPLRFATLAGLLMLAAGLATAAAPAAAAATATGTAHRAGNTGWIRLAHLSPNTPPVDVYLYSFGGSNAMIVLHHVGYGAVSPYAVSYTHLTLPTIYSV